MREVREALASAKLNSRNNQEGQTPVIQTQETSTSLYDFIMGNKIKFLNAFSDPKLTAFNGKIKHILQCIIVKDSLTLDCKDLMLEREYNRKQKNNSTKRSYFSYLNFLKSPWIVAPSSFALGLTAYRYIPALTQKYYFSRR